MPNPRKLLFAFISRLPFAFTVVLIDIIVFLSTWIIAGTLEGSRWTATLLRIGAQFNPLTLDKEWYRMFTHIFLHGSILQLAINVYVLLYVGYALESRVGTKKFAFVFFLSAMASALASLYWNLFTVNMGASGTVCGLMGFYLVYNIFFSGKSVQPMAILLVHFSVFAAANLFLPERVYADYAAMFGGVIAGVAVGFFSFARGRDSIVTKVKAEYVMVPLLMLLFVLMPGYQVRYFRFFQQMVAAEDTTRYLLKDKLTDDDMRTFIRNYHHWEEIGSRLNRQKGLPGDLARDTFKLGQYISLRKQENLLKKMVVQREAYVYLDSIERLQEVMRRYMDLDYGLWSRIRATAPGDSILESRMVKIRYDSNGVETDEPPVAFYREGVRDSLGRWDGPFREYDAQHRLRIRGSFKRNKRDGVFLFYDENGACREAGRFLDGNRFGKWETFHRNGQIESEIFYNDGYFVSSVWDSAGSQLVVDGNGREVQLYADAVVKVDGEYRHGLKEGTWYGRYFNGDMHYEEIYNLGRLVAGKSRTMDGETFLYDESSLFPIPEGGFAKFQEYLKSEAKKFKSDELGHVKVSFRVMKNGAIADLTIDQGATPALDAKAMDILRSGPRWQPARRHGYQKVDARAYVQVEFY